MTGGGRRQGFTLIELAIVLVVIGLVVGGVLVGQDLINAANLRATITQIEKYNQAVNTFRAKFDALPGDIPAALVTQYGFTAAPVRAGTRGRSDGNGALEGFLYPSAIFISWSQTGETAFFWEDLSANSHLIEGEFHTATDGTLPTNYFGAAVSIVLPPAKIGGGNYFYVYSGAPTCSMGTVFNAMNYFGLSAVNILGLDGAPYGGPGLSVMQAYKIDQKLDDGLPTTGRVVAQYVFAPSCPSAIGWAASASTPSATTCFDTTSNQYSIGPNNGAGVNCGLSFKFQ